MNTTLQMNSLSDYQKGEDKSHFCSHCSGSNDTEKSSSFLSLGKEKLFNKVLKQSDVMQYRLAIPKQQAKKYFSPHVDVAGSSQGVFLCMEDERGQIWRFKYSYWKSSQGYVLTNEWSQYVRVNNLCPGDVVSFLQSTGSDKRLFVDCKKQAKSGTTVDGNQSIETGSRRTKIKLFGVDI